VLKIGVDGDGEKVWRGVPVAMRVIFEDSESEEGSGGGTLQECDGRVLG
jgi:hypothetical protein